MVLADRPSFDLTIEHVERAIHVALTVDPRTAAQVLGAVDPASLSDRIGRDWQECLSGSSANAADGDRARAEGCSALARDAYDGYLYGGPGVYQTLFFTVIWYMLGALPDPYLADALDTIRSYTP